MQTSLLRPSREVSPIPWPLNDVVAGLIVLGALILLQRLKPFPENPLTAQLFQFAIVIFSLACMAIYSLVSCRRNGCWPILKITTIAEIVREFLVSSWYMLLILIVCGLLLVVPALILKPGMGPQETLTGIGGGPSTAIFMSLLATAITLGPLAEELFFRGFLYNALKSRISIPQAAMVQALAFSAFHQYDLFNSIRVFLFGIAFVIVYEKRKTIIAPISAHVFVNTIAMLPLLLTTAVNLHPSF